MNTSVAAETLRQQAFAARLRRELDAEVLFDSASRGRYSTDASIYQIEPIGVVIPRSDAAAVALMQWATAEALPLLPRGAGSSQCGQTVGAALVIDTSKYLNRVLEVNTDSGTAWVEPGVVLDQLNGQLRHHGLWFPVDVSTAAQATIGGMAGNNSSGSRSIRYGNMVHNVMSIDACLADGSLHRFEWVGRDTTQLAPPTAKLVAAVRDLQQHHAADIERDFPKLLRRVGGYNLDLVAPDGHNMSHLLVGSEGTLAYFRRIQVQLAPLPPHKALGVCHFPSFRSAMALTQEIVKLKPDAVELVDRTMIDLARAHEAFRGVVAKFVRGEPDALLLVEFTADDANAPPARLRELDQLMADHGLAGSVEPITEPALQREVWEVRKAGLNIMMSMKGDGKPVSFIEDCAVPLEHLAEYTEKLTEVFARHGTRGTWYAHASVGCLHVRPVLNMKSDGAHKLRAIAEEAADLVRRFKGSYSGEHGDGLVRSEWIEPMFGAPLTRAFESLKAIFDPTNRMNPGKIVYPSKQDDRKLFRFKPGYRTQDFDTQLDWSSWGGFAGAVEMCNNNGACRKFDAGTMCPSFRATRDEVHLTRGRANTLRLALSDQIDAAGIDGAAVADALELCVSCKGCKRECPTGVDIARMKIEANAQRATRHGLPWLERRFAKWPHEAANLARLGPLLQLVQHPPLARVLERLTGFSAKRRLPRPRRDAFLRRGAPLADDARARVVLFVDTFNNWLEPDNAAAAHAVLQAASGDVAVARHPTEARPLCCGRTLLAGGLVREARAEANRTLDALAPYLDRGVPIVGIEPACTFTFRDEYLALGLGARAERLAELALGLDEFLAADSQSQLLRGKLRSIPGQVLVHGHCHQKAFGSMAASERVLRLIPELTVATIPGSCCGMAGSFGYLERHHDLSMRMAEADLLPAVRAASTGTLLVASGVSCRQQIADGTARQAKHLAQVLNAALANGL
jgi:FAD/FMN-containing dehydrogenase/Fe-S oxidoreductase